MSRFDASCPTCGSDDPDVRYVVAEFDNGAERECDDGWHDEAMEGDDA